MGGSGYFDDGAMIRRVHGERVVALSGPRALLMMAAHPVAFEGFFMATGSIDEPYLRLRRTAQVMDAVAWGTREEADRLTGFVRSMHADARGTLPRAAGRHPAGTEWRADDPELLLWILACLVDSAMLVYERYVHGLAAADRDRYVRDYATVARLFGIPDGLWPADARAFRAYMNGMLEGDELLVTPIARAVGKDIVMHPPLDWRRRPLLELVNTITTCLLPAGIRQQYGLWCDPLRALAVRGGAVYTKRLLLPVVPGRVRRFSPAA